MDRARRVEFGWGIIGTGTIAGTFASALGSLREARGVAVCSRDEQRAREFAARHGLSTGYGAIGSLLADPGIDVVYIATPHTEHARLAIQCLEAGKSVLCEKPLATSSDAVRQIAAAARSAGRFCMEGMWMRFQPILGILQEQLAKQAIGELRRFRAELGFPHQPSVRSRLFDPARGGGALLDLGVYPLALAHLVLDKPTVVAAQAITGETGVDEQVSCLLRDRKGCEGLITASLRSRSSNEAMIEGTTGYLHLHAPLYRPTQLTLHRSAPSVRDDDSSGRRGRAAQWKQQLTRLPAVQAALQRLGQGRVKPSRSWFLPSHGTGYEYEILETHRSIQAGLIESKSWSLSDSEAVLELVESIQSSWVSSRRLDASNAI
jgi:predicted dehydrogenase